MGTISVHIHPNTKEFVEAIRIPLMRMAGGLPAEERFLQPRSAEEIIADMDAHGIEKSVLLPLDARTRGEGYVPNDLIADLVRQYPDRFIGFANVDPHMGQEAIKELERAIKQLGLKGWGEVDGSKQDFCPSDRQFYPLYQKCVELDIPVLFHTGNSPGYPMMNTNPIYIDQVACDFPQLRICMAHIGFPWHDLAISIAWLRPNVYIDINAFRPRYFPPQVVQYMNGVLRHKYLFAHDFPAADTKKIMDEFEELPLRPEVKKMIKEDNPRRFLGI